MSKVTLSILILLAVEYDTVILGLEPLHGVLLGESVLESNMSGLATSVTDIHARSTHDHVKVHSIDSNAWVILDAKINVFLDTEAKVSVLGEVLSSQLILLDLKSTLQDLFSLGSPDSAMNGNLLISSDTE